MRLPVNHALPLAALVLLAGCFGGGGGRHPAVVADPAPANGPAADYPVVIGAPFNIEGVTYTPSDALNYDMVGYAASGSDGGEGVSIAHKTLPVPSYAEVTSLESGKTILVRVERRGPMSNDRLVELSPGAAAQLGVAGNSKAPVRIRRVNPPEIERAMLRSKQRVPERMDTPQPLLAVLKRKLDPALVIVAAPSPEPTPSAIPSPVSKPKPATKPSGKPHPVAQPAPQASPTPVVVPTPVAASKPGRFTPPRVAPTPRPTSSPVAKPPPQPAARATPSSTPAGSFIIQLGAFANAQNASTAASKAGGQVRQSGRFLRVILGPFTNRAQAEAALAKARAGGYSDARIQRAD